MDIYLQTTKKTLDQIKKDEEIEAEIKTQNHPDADKAEYQRHIANSIINRKLLT